MALGINTTSIALPNEVSNEIIQKLQEGSAVMRLAQKVDLPSRGLTIPVIMGDPTPAWVSETDKKAVSKPSLATKLMSAYTLAVIVPFSNQFKNSAGALYDALVQRLPLVLAKEFDRTVFGGTKSPGENFDTFEKATAQDIGTDIYKALVGASADIAEHDGIANGFIISPQMKSELLLAVDGNKRPLFIGTPAEGAVPTLLGAPTFQSKGAYIAGSPKVLGVVGDWSKAMYGTVNDVKIDISDQATLDDNGTQINLWQQNMFAVRAEIEIGFRCDVSAFNKLTKAA
jgi:hypothetical protein|nr:MAG TPA: Major capsid protein [Caudoviricetes sp.]